MYLKQFESLKTWVISSLRFFAPAYDRHATFPAQHVTTNRFYTGVPFTIEKGWKWPNLHMHILSVLEMEGARVLQWLGIVIFRSCFLKFFFSYLRWKPKNEMNYKNNQILTWRQKLWNLCHLNFMASSNFRSDYMNPRPILFVFLPTPRLGEAFHWIWLINFSKKNYNF